MDPRLPALGRLSTTDPASRRYRFRLLNGEVDVQVRIERVRARSAPWWSRR